MANELSGSESWTYSKNGSSQTWTTGTVGITVSGSKAERPLIGVSTNVQEILLGDVLGNGYVFARNFSSVTINIGVTTPFQISMKPKEPARFRMNGTTLFAQNTGANVSALVEVFVIDD